jgi:hypothetical protein
MARAKSTPIAPVTPVEKQPPPETGAASAGQSGDLQGLPGREDVENESVRELIEEGQFYEAELVDAVENGPVDETRPLRPRQMPEDDVPLEYTDQLPDEPIE